MPKTRKQLLLSPKELKKFINDLPKDKRDILQNFLEKRCEELLNHIKDQLKIELSPNAHQQMGKELYSNLFGLLTSAMTGTLAIPVTQYLGNALGINDWNPYNGTAPIDTINSLQDTQFGDSMSLNAATAVNYLQLGEIVEMIADQLRQSGLAPGLQTPRPGQPIG